MTPHTLPALSPLPLAQPPRTHRFGFFLSGDEPFDGYTTDDSAQAVRMAEVA